MIQPVKEKIILGIDPGTTIMGYGILRVKGTKPEMIAMGIIDLRKFANHYLKLRHIHERVLSIIESRLDRAYEISCQGNCRIRNYCKCHCSGIYEDGHADEIF